MFVDRLRLCLPATRKVRGHARYSNPQVPYFFALLRIRVSLPELEVRRDSTLSRTRFESDKVRDKVFGVVLVRTPWPDAASVGS